MTRHYYDEAPSVNSDRREVIMNIGNERLVFLTDRGVFSKAGVDYGSKFLATSFSEPKVQGDLLDVGCGYGPLGISIAKTTGRDVWMTDINERAVMLAKENARNNGVSNIHVVQGESYEAIPNTRRFAAIVTNPPIRAGKHVVHHFFEEGERRLVEGGELWVVIQKKQGAPSAKKKLEELFDEVDEVAKSKGYSLLRGRK